MFRRSPESLQPTMFNSNSTLLSGKSFKIYEGPIAWHNQFRNQVTMRIDESIFEPLYNKGMGTPNASIRILISMMILKEAEGLSDQKLFENCRFNFLTIPIVISQQRRQQSQGICCHPVTESCDDDQELNLIGNVEVREVSTSDTDFLQDGTCRAQRSVYRKNRTYSCRWGLS